MAGEQGSFDWRLAALFALGFVAPLLMEFTGLISEPAGPYLSTGLVAAALIAVLGRKFAAQQPESQSVATPAVLRGLALATDTLSAPFFLGLAGAVFAWGHDGLAFALGIGAGILLLQLLIAPVLPRLEVRSVPELFAQRFGGRGPRFASALIVVVSMTVLLVAQLMAAGLIVGRVRGLEPHTAVAVAAAAMLLCLVIRGTTGNAYVRGFLFPVMLAAFLAPAIQISFERYGIPVPQIAYANALWQIQGLEETLLEQELADPAVLKPILTPFLLLTPLNFCGLVLGLALGVASLPNVLSRHFMATTVRSARWSAVWALLFVALILSAAPALAAYAKLVVLGMIADRTEIAQLPAWVFTYGKLGLVEICGRAATDVATAASACAALPDAAVAGGALRLQDLALDPDMIALAAPEIAGTAGTMLGLLAAAALAAALVTADGPLVAIAGALGWGSASPATSLTARLTPYAIAAAAVSLAALAATTRPAGFLTVATWALVLAASGLFPALVAALWWPRATAWGVTASMLTGLAVAIFYLVGTRYCAVAFFEAFEGLSSAGPTARETFAELKQAGSAAGAGPAGEAAWTALDVHARTIANWWGIKGLAAALLALPAGIVALVAVSLATPAKSQG
jgi:cation/acetate symporter